MQNDDSLAFQVSTLLGRMTLKEKIRLLAGKDDWNTSGVARLGIPSLSLVDGPHGVRIVNDGRRWKGATTSFPTGASMAACWNPGLIEEMGGAIAEEVLGVGGDILLGPCVNIVRHPLSGRNFETFTEDPFLAGRLAVAYIRGVQSQGVGASLKHFACNNQEVERLHGNSEVDERTLREIYLPAFETAVQEAGPWTVMCAYNRINGSYASENRYLLDQILRQEWGFKGIVLSDWGATHSTVESVSAGLDIEMPGPAKFTLGLEAAVQSLQIDEAVIDRSVSRILRVLLLSGKMGDASARRKGCLNTPAHMALARQLAEESIVLLKNERGLLPFALEGNQSIAVLGPNADELQLSGGGSSEIDRPFLLATPLDALRERLKGRVDLRFEAGALNYEKPPIIDIRRLKPLQGQGYGLLGEYFDNSTFSGEPRLTQVDANMNLWWGGSSPAPELSPHVFSARWTGTLSVLHSADYTLQMVCSGGECRVFLDGDRIVEISREDAEAGKGTSRWIALQLEPGKAYGFRMEYVRHSSAGESAGLTPFFGIAPGSDLSRQLAQAVELAHASDLAIVFVGMSRRFEQEGSDRPDLRLPGNQDELIRAVARANPRTIVVLNAGAPVAMPWANDVAAILDVFYPGQDGAGAIADILTGVVSPSGRLAVTFPRRIEDTPAFLDYPGTRGSRYGEGIFVGYRYYDKRLVEPLFPFGFGLSYTNFAYSGMDAPQTFLPDEEVSVSLTVTNTGARRGKEVVQLYVNDEVSSLTRPVRELKGFAKVDLAPGESTVVNFRLGMRAFSFYDPHQGRWVAEPGEFLLQVGSSSRDIRATARLTMLPDDPAACCHTPSSAADHAVVGAIRWDAWYGEGFPVTEVERALGPRKFHCRLPFFATVVSDSAVRINGDTQAVMDQEIAYANAMGLDYWAFLDYTDMEAHGNLTIALRRYLEAKDRGGLRYCLIEGGGIDKYKTDHWTRLVGHFTHHDYQLVLDRRPLLYIYAAYEMSKTLTKDDVTALAEATIAAGLNRPYMVLMGVNPEKDIELARSFGFDAVTSYPGGDAFYSGEMPTYQQRTEHIEKVFWEGAARHAIPTVTFASAGWDTRPRIEHPNCWYPKGAVPVPDPTPPSQQRPLIDAVTATPAQLARHLHRAVDWTQRHRDLNPANAVIIYAWNEHDEGGWLCPTLNPDSSPNLERLAALRSVLRGSGEVSAKKAGLVHDLA